MNKKELKREFKKIMKDFVYIIIGFNASIYYLLQFINNIIAKLFMKLPRLAKVVVIYTLIILSVRSFTTKKIIIEKEILGTEILPIQEIATQEEQQTTQEENTTTIEETQQENTLNFEYQQEKDIYTKALEIGATHEQALVMISISRHETGHWTSDAFLNKNNFGGIMCNNATQIKKFNSYDEGLEAFVTLLKYNYFDNGYNTIEKIGARYCPIGAENDPNNLNQYWVGGVTNFYNNYLNTFSK